MAHLKCRAGKAAVLRLAFAIALVTTSWPAEPQAPPNVIYSADSITVDGVKYERDERAVPHELGSILVTVIPGAQLDLSTVLQRYGLQFERRYSTLPELFTVAVPVGYETQWVAALLQLPIVKAAGVNRRVFPT